MTEDNLQILHSQAENIRYKAENMVELLEKKAREIPDKPVYIFLEDGVNEKQRITFRELSENAKIIATVLQENASKNDRILLIFPNGIEFITNLFGVFYAGMIGVPIYAPRKNRNNSRFKTVVEDCGAKIILTNSKIHKDLDKNFKDEPCLEDKKLFIHEEIINRTQRWKDPMISGDDLAILQYTSGSTGNPNGVMVSHMNIIHNSEIINQGFKHDGNSMGTNWLPNFHDMGLIGALLQPVYMGFCNVIIPPGEFIRNPVNWLKAISKYKTTTAGGPNFAFDYCTSKISEEEKKDINLSSLKVLFCGAEPIHKNTLNNFTKEFNLSGFKSRQFYPCYGLAEYVLMVTGGDLQEDPVYFEADNKKLELGLIEKAGSGDSTSFVACGHPWLGTTVAIINPETRMFCKSNEIGEIWVKGKSMTKGYWNNPEETDYTFNAFIQDNDDGPYLRTGDLGFIYGGQLYVTGRIKDLIIIRGLNHYPQDIEKTAESSHEALQDNASAAFSIIAANEERLVLVHEIKRTHIRDFDAEEIYDAIRLSVSDEHQVLPYAIILIRTGSIPKTSSGKIQRLASKKAYKAGELMILDQWIMELQENVPFGLKDYNFDELKAWLTNWLASKKGLNPSSIDPDKPIASYGLDSILAINLEKDVNETFGISWPIESFLKENTINSLVKEGMELLNGTK